MRSVKHPRVSQSCTSDDELPPHYFTYYESGKKVGGYPYFPSRLSQATDHWGYYNGVYRNDRQKLNIPRQRVFLKDKGLTVYDVYIGESDRNSTEGETAYLGNLHQHYYPTGGHTKFTYESNRVANLRNPRSKMVQLTDKEMTNCTSYGDPYTPGNDCFAQYKKSVSLRIDDPL